MRSTRAGPRTQTRSSRRPGGKSWASGACSATSSWPGPWRHGDRAAAWDTWIVGARGHNRTDASAGGTVGELTCLEICAGAGGQSLGLEQAGFAHLAAVEIDPDACQTLRGNRPPGRGEELDVHTFAGEPFRGVDLLAGGVPCPPFSIAGKQLGADDERDLFPQALRLVDECEPTAIMLENVSGLSTARFAAYRSRILEKLHERQYETSWQLVNACNFGVPQLRPRFILVAMTADVYEHFEWPTDSIEPLTV